MTTTKNEVNDYVVTSYIDIHNDDDEDFDTKVYYCSYCHIKLSYNRKEPNTGKHEFLCQKCNIPFYPANEIVRKANKFETPGGEEEPLTSICDDSPYTQPSSTVYSGKQKLPKSFEMLQKKAGFHFTHFEEH